MKQTNIEKLKQIVLDMINNGGTEEDLPAVIAHIEQLQQEEPRMYTEEEMDRAVKDAFYTGLSEGKLGTSIHDEPFVPDPSKQRIA